MPFNAPDPAKLLLLTNWVGLFNPFLVKRWNTPTRVWFESSHEYYTRKIRSKRLQNFMVWGNCQQVFTRTIFLFALKECFTLCLLNRGNLWYYHLAYYHFNPRLDSKKRRSVISLIITTVTKFLNLIGCQLSWFQPELDSTQSCYHYFFLLKGRLKKKITNFENKLVYLSGDSLGETKAHGSWGPTQAKNSDGGRWEGKTCDSDCQQKETTESLLTKPLFP